MLNNQMVNSLFPTFLAKRKPGFSPSNLNLRGTGHSSFFSNWREKQRTGINRRRKRSHPQQSHHIEVALYMKNIEKLKNQFSPLCESMFPENSHPISFPSQENPRRKKVLQLDPTLQWTLTSQVAPRLRRWRHGVWGVTFTNKNAGIWW